MEKREEIRVLSADNREAIGQGDGTVTVRRAVTLDETWSLQGHEGRVLALAWSPDNTLVASGGNDRRVCVWDATSGELVCAEEHSGPVTAIAWSPDGRSIASGAGLELKHWPVAVLAA